MKKNIKRFLLLICIFSVLFTGCDAVSDLLEDAGLKESSTKNRNKDDEDSVPVTSVPDIILDTDAPYNTGNPDPFKTSAPDQSTTPKTVITSTPKPVKTRDELLYEEACSLIENFENRYYISKLRGDELEDFIALYRSYIDCNSDCKLPCLIDSQQLHVLMFYLNYECPELVMYSSDDYTYYYSDSTRKLIKSVKLPLLFDKATAENYRAAAEAKINSLLLKTNGMTDLQKELFFYEYIMMNNKYVLDNENSASVYGVLIEGEGRCEGIAKTMKWCMEKCGIECICIRGLKSDIAYGAHVWNCIRINGKFYDLDITMDDIDKSNDGSIGQFPVPYGLFNVSSSFERSKYDIDEANLKFGIPGTDSMEMSYHYLNGTQVSNSSEAISLLKAQMADLYDSNDGSGIAMVQITDNVEAQYVKDNIESVIKKWLSDYRIDTYNYQWYYYSESGVILIEISF